jgi:(p)ppGpp synthase/HD superfamily hydrolase
MKRLQSDIAREIATLAHRGQYRRDGITAYIHHPEAVVERVRHLGDDYMAVAWLHDVLEDTDYTVEMMLDKGIQPHIIEAVQLLSKTDISLGYLDYLRKLKANSLARWVKIADMISNLADNPTPKQIKKYAQGLLFLIDDDLNFI